MRADSRRLALATAFLVAASAVAARGAVAQATIRVVNDDSAGVGMNDPSPVTPVGGNSGTTLGQQRFNAVQKAADLWAVRINSSVEIVVSASFPNLDCNATSTVLAAAGPTNVVRNFTSAPLTNVWYPSALASRYANVDQVLDQPDINARINLKLDGGCAFPARWYYGLDANAPSGTIDLVTVLNHELAHGLGFITFVDLTTGARFQGFDDVFMKLLFDGTTGKNWAQMTDGERMASAVNRGNLLWNGPLTTAAASGAYSSGLGLGGRVKMYAPLTIETGSSVTHWDTSLTPNEALEPFYTTPLHQVALVDKALFDIGWTASTLPLSFWLLPSAARAPGTNGAFFTTDLSVGNPGTTEASFTLRFLGHDADGRNGAERTFTLAAGKSATYADVLSSVFGKNQDFGAIRIASTASSLAVLSQTATPGFGGTFGQSVPALAENEWVQTGAGKSILGIREDGSFRTNLILANGTEKTLAVDARLISADGVSLGTKRYTLPPLGMTQISKVARDMGVNGNVQGARLALSTPTLDGAFAAYAAVIDNHTNDPRTLLPR